MNTMVIPHRTTLLRLVINNKSRFYNQDWYYNEEFANTDVGGTWEYSENTATPLLPAGVLAYMYIQDIWVVAMAYNCIWTSDKDKRGDPVYLGLGYQNGLQIHRHLDIRKLSFANRLEE